MEVDMSDVGVGAVLSQQASPEHQLVLTLFSPVVCLHQRPGMMWETVSSWQLTVSEDTGWKGQSKRFWCILTIKTSPISSHSNT